MKTNRLTLCDWVRGCVSGKAMRVTPELLRLLPDNGSFDGYEPIAIDSDFLLLNGWRAVTHDQYVIDFRTPDGGKLRFGWFLSSGRLVVGYTDVPRPVRDIDELQRVIRSFGYEGYANSLKLPQHMKTLSNDAR